MVIQEASKQIEHIRGLEENYRQSCRVAKNSERSINAFHEWINAVIVFLGNYFPADNEVGWLFNLDKAAKINDSSSLDHLQEVLSDRLGLQLKPSNKWNPCVKSFLKHIDAIEVSSEKESISEQFISETSIDEEYKKLQIEKLKQESEDRKKASIHAESYKTKSGTRTLSIFNRGKAKALKLHIDVPKPDQIYACDPELPCTLEELRPNDHRDFMLYLSEGDDELTLVYTWEDEFRQDNKETQIVDL